MIYYTLKLIETQQGSESSLY